jgi:tetratricopeptide (TPR) repeat protein
MASDLSSHVDTSDAQSWYLLGRCYMSQQKYPKAYEAYQQAVYRDGRNPTFWCSIGVLYYQINQYRDALDAYSRAIRLNPNISEVWYDLGTLVSHALLLCPLTRMYRVLTVQSTSRATTRPRMPSTLTSEQPNSTRLTSISRLASNCFKVARPPTVCQTKVRLRYHKTYIPRHINRPSMARRRRNGVRPRLAPHNPSRLNRLSWITLAA